MASGTLLGILYNFDTSYRNRFASLRNGFLAETAQASQYNMDGILHLRSLLSMLMRTGEAWGRSFADAIHFTLNNFQASNEEVQNRYGEIEVAAHFFMDQRMTSPVSDEETEQRKSLNLMNYFISRMGQPAQVAMSAVYSFAIIQSWTAFEVLATDLWMEALNRQPDPLAWRAVEFKTKKIRVRPATWEKTFPSVHYGNTRRTCVKFWEQS